MFRQILVLVTFVSDHDCGLVNLDQKEEAGRNGISFCVLSKVSHY